MKAFLVTLLLVVQAQAQSSEDTLRWVFIDTVTWHAPTKSGGVHIYIQNDTLKIATSLSITESVKVFLDLVGKESIKQQRNEIYGKLCKDYCQLRYLLSYYAMVIKECRAVGNAVVTEEKNLALVRKHMKHATCDCETLKDE